MPLALGSIGLSISEEETTTLPIYDTGGVADTPTISFITCTYVFSNTD
jgi:hypothetical protein